MKDIKFIVLFAAIGLGIAYVASGPIRHPGMDNQNIGTPLHQEESHLDSEVYAQGVISLGPKMIPADAANRTLFIIARSPAGGPPIAVKKIEPTAFPLMYSLGVENNMVGTEFYEGDIVVIARLDEDGAAGPKQPGDWEGSASLSASDAARKADILIQP